MTNEQQKFFNQLIKEKDYNYGQVQLIKDVIKLGLSEQEVIDFVASWDTREIIIPEGVETIGKCTFYNCKNLEKVILPSALKEIGECAFDSCTSLKELTILEGIKIIGGYAFCNCKNLENITLPSTLKEIEYCTFAD